MIEVREGLDHRGHYLVQGAGKAAPTLALLAEALGVAESELRLRPRLLDKPRRNLARLNSGAAIAARSDFDPF